MLEFHNPCSKSIKNFDFNNEQFNCSKCSKQIYDLRDGSTVKMEEIPLDACIIIEKEKVKTNYRNLYHRIALKALSILALLNLNTGPVFSQEKIQPESKRPLTELTCPKEKSVSSKDKTLGKDEKKKRKRRRRSKKKPNTLTIGCPSF